VPLSLLAELSLKVLAYLAELGLEHLALRVVLLSLGVVPLSLLAELGVVPLSLLAELGLKVLAYLCVISVAGTNQERLLVLQSFCELQRLVQVGLQLVVLNLSLRNLGENIGSDARRGSLRL
jgi:hypothetical protein